MADYSNIGLRDDSASEQTDNWNPIGKLARKLVEDAARKLAEKAGGGA